MTSYAMMTYVLRGLQGEALPVMQWLISQRNSKGGFASTQDTVVGLQALAELAEHFSLTSGEIRLVFAHGSGPESKTEAEGGQVAVVVNSANSMVLQTHELPHPGQIRSVEVSAEGTGFALAQVSWSFNEATAGKHPRFRLSAEVADQTTPSSLALKVCSSFIVGSWGTESNMAVVEVSLPSGFAVDQEALPALRSDEKVRRVETKDQDTVLILYFDKMEAKEHSVTVFASRTHLVENQKPVPVTVYDYYDQTRRARVFYKLPPADVPEKQPL